MYKRQVHGRVDEFTFEELRGMRLCGTQETIPLLTEVFEVMGGRTPMIIELKTCLLYTSRCV